MTYLTLYRFTNDFTVNDSCNINAVLATDNYHYPLFQAMGFDGEKDYINSYPSEFLRKSEYGKLFNADVDDSFIYPCIQDELMCVNLMDYKYDPQEDENLDEFLESIADNILHGFVFLFPTVSEILECEVFKNVNHMYTDTVVARFPFCLDYYSYGS